MRSIPALLAILVLAGCGASSSAQTTTAAAPPPDTATTRPAPPARAAAPRGVRLRSIGRFSSPIYVTAPPGDTHRLFVVQRGGSVIVLRDGRRAGTFLHVDTTTDGERGLLSMAFAPDYAQSGLVYVYYTDPSGTIRVDEFHAGPTANRVDPGSQRHVLSIPHPESNHNGGQLEFGPDGLLYIGVGDGGSEGDPQPLRPEPRRPAREDPAHRPARQRGQARTRCPPTTRSSGARARKPEIYAYGLRNPWRFSFDRSTGALVIGDVGQDKIEEVDYEAKGAAKGANFGWSVFEGRSPYNPGSAPGAVPPVLQQTHASGWCSIVGGYVVRDASVPALRGRYVYGDLCQPQLHAARLRPHSASDRTLSLRVSQLVSFGQDAAGHVYAVSLTGPVYRIDAG